MLKRTETLLKREQIIRFVCVIVMFVCLAFLSGCAEMGGGQGETAAAAERETMNCWTCSLFELAFTVVNSITNNVVASVAQSAVPLLGAAYALWLAVYILQYVASLKEPDTPAFWKGLAVQTFFVTICAGMLRDLAGGSESSVINMITDPVFSGFVDTGLLIIQSSGSDLPCGPGGPPDSGLICLISALQQKLNVTVGFGYILLSMGPSVFLMLIGVGIYIVSLYMMVYFPVLLLDCAFRYCIVIAMLPLSIVAYCFKITREMAGKTMKVLVEIGLGIVGMCVFIAVVVEVMAMYIDRFVPYLRDALSFQNDPAMFEEAATGPGITGLIFVIIFLLCFADLILDLMFQFSGGVGGQGSTIKATAAVVKDAGKKAAKFGGKVAAFGVKRGMRQFDKAAKNTKEELERKKASGETLSDKDQKKLNMANDYLAERGYLAKDKDGHMAQGAGANLHKTQAYDNLGKKGFRNFVKGVANDWNAPVLNDPSRHNHERNRVSDGYKGDVE